MSGEITKLYIALGLDDKDFKDGLKGINKDLKNISNAMALVGENISRMTQPLIDFAREAVSGFAATGEELTNLSIKTGMTVEMLSGLKYAIESTGGSTAGLETAFRNMSKVVADAEEGNIAASTAIRKLGLSVSEVRNMTPDELFMSIASSIAAIPDPVKRSSAAVAIFGRTGTDLLPMLENGAIGMQELFQKAADLGLLMDGETAAGALALSDAMQDTQASVEGLKYSIAEALSPDLVNLTANVNEIIGRMSDWAKENPGMVKAIMEVVAAVSVMAIAFTVAAAALATLRTLFGDPSGWVALGAGVVAAGMTVGAINKLLAPENSSILGGPVWGSIGDPNDKSSMLGGPTWFDIPKMAAGGIAMSPMMAIVGDNPSGEAVIPLDRLGGMGQAGAVTNINIYPQNVLSSKQELFDLVRDAALGKSRDNRTWGVT